ncbi:MAG: maleylpyruvate isomerase family mycothiol-dependent enzyme [Acidimicrobiales bacterium]
MTEGWDLVAENRQAVADLIEGFDDEQFNGPTLCGEWRVRDVAGHLTSFVDLSLPKFFFNMAKAGFNYDKAADRMARSLGERSQAELVQSLRTNAAKSSPLPMFPPEMSLTDVAIHTQDIRRAHELGNDLSETTVATALEFLTHHKQARAIIDPDSIKGLAFQATDIDWSFGEGPAVQGAAEAILMAMANRPVGADELSGDGVATLVGG